MKPRVLAACVVALVFVLTPCAYGAQLNFTPSITMEQEYNDNLFLTNDFEEDDWITRARLDLEASILGRTSGLEVNYSPAYEWYEDFSEFDGWTHNAFARFYSDFTANTRLELTNAYLQGRDALQRGQTATPDDPLVPPSLPTDASRRGRGEQRRNATTARLDHQFGANDTVYAEAAYSFLRGLETPNFTDDNDIIDFGVGGTYWLTNLWGLGADLAYSNREYDIADDREQYYGRLRLNRRINRHLTGYAQYQHTVLDYSEGLSTDYDLYEPSVGFDYQLDQNTRIDMAFGWYFLDEDTGDNDDDFIITATADKVWPFRRGLFGITLLSGYDIQDRGTSDLGLNIYYEGILRAQYDFLPRLSSVASFGYRYDDFPRAEPGQTEDWQTWTGTAGLEYQALRWMFLNLDYRFRKRVSDIDNDEYTENRVFFSITFRPTTPFRTSW